MFCYRIVVIRVHESNLEINKYMQVGSWKVVQSGGEIISWEVSRCGGELVQGGGGDTIRVVGTYGQSRVTLPAFNAHRDSIS